MTTKTNAIISTINSSLTTSTDFLNTFLFGGAKVATSTIIYDNNLSNMMTNIFSGTKINVFVYNSKIINAFTVIGISNPGYSTASAVFAEHILWIQKIPLIGPVLISIFASVIFGIKGLKSIGYAGTNERLTYNPMTQKFTIVLPEITCYISSSFIYLLENDEQVKAVLLHEIGHNTMIFMNIIQTLLHTTFCGYTLYEAIELLITNQSYNPSDGIADNFIGKSVMRLLLVAIIFAYITCYFQRRQEIYCDEFAIKCGYGEHLSRAMQLIKNHYSSVKSKISTNIVDGIIFLLHKLIFHINNLFGKIKLADYPDIDTRIKYIDDKTKLYDTSDTNINRTSHIDNSILM